jgi:hypothetical protein
VPMIRRTVTPAPSSIDWSNRMKLFTPSQIPITVPLVADGAQTLYVNPPYASTIPDFIWAWLKGTPRVEEDTSGRSSLTEEWILNFWPDSLYESAEL